MKNEEKIQFGIDLFNSLTNLGSTSKNIKVKEILEKKSYKEILDQLILNFEELEEPVSYYIQANCYYNKGAKFRIQSLKFYKKFLENPIFINTSNEKEDIGIVYRNMGIILEKEYFFEEALKYFKLSLKYLEDFPSSYCRIGGVYYKMNDIDKAIKILKEAKKTIYYKKDKLIFKPVIDKSLQNFLDIKKTGKIYKPRKKKTNIL